MRLQLFMPSLLTVILCTCAPKIDTGRNGSTGSNHSEIGNGGPGDNPGEPGAPGPNGQPGPGQGPNGGNLVNVECFTSQAQELPAAVAKVCDEQIKPNPLLAKIYTYACEKKYLVSAINQASCGWEGDESNINQFMHVYERESEASGKDYYDVHATALHLPTSVDKTTHFIRLVFENYAQFKAEGFQWLSGTRENSNLNNGTFDNGVQFRFRLDKDIYELGYSGHVQIFKIDDKTWMQVMYADKDFVRVKNIAQVTYYHELADGTTMAFKLEHKSVESKGLYRRAWQGAIEIAQDLMKKSMFNATKGQ